MLRQRADEIWPDPDTLVPVFFSVSRTIGRSTLGNLYDLGVGIVGAETAVTLAKRNGDAVSIWTSHRRNEIDVARRQDIRDDQESGEVARQIIGRTSILQLLEVPPYINVHSAIGTKAKAYRVGTIVFPYVALQKRGKNPGGLVSFDVPTLKEAYEARREGFSPSLIYDLDAALEALKAQR